MKKYPFTSLTSVEQTQTLVKLSVSLALTWIIYCQTNGALRFAVYLSKSLLIVFLN